MNMRVVNFIVNIVLISLSFISASTTKTASNVPLLIWTSNSFFGDDAQLTMQQSVTQTEFHKLMTDIVNSQGYKKLLDGSVPITQPKPEVIVAFVYDQLSSEEIAVESGSYIHPNHNDQSSFPLSNIKNIFLESKSSLSIPYLKMEKISSSLVNIISENSNSKIIATYLENKVGSVTGCDALLTELQERTEINNNGITDLVLVQYHHQKDKDNCLSRVLMLVKELSKNSYLALLSADSAKVPVQMTFGEDLLIETGTNLIQIQPTLFATSSISESSPLIYPGVIYASSNSLFVVFLSIFLLFILFTGVSCVMSIESPPRFPGPHQSLPISKEY